MEGGSLSPGQGALKALPVEAVALHGRVELRGRVGQLFLNLP